MPRHARTQSSTGIYHIVLRGINKQVLFEDEDDIDYFLDTLAKYREVSGYTLFAYCLMGNHVHLLMKEGNETFGTAFKRIGGRYVYRHNNKYCRAGHLFQDRFRSEVVENDEYLFAVVRYIHQNPVKTGLSKTCDYPYSSYPAYTGTAQSALVDTSMLLEMMSLGEFVRYHEAMGDEACLDVTEREWRRTDEEAITLIHSVCGPGSPTLLQTKDLLCRNLALRNLKDQGLSIRQISRLTGISVTVVARA